jgi:hypothetical protein
MLKWLNKQADNVFSGFAQGAAIAFILWLFDANITINI